MKLMSALEFGSTAAFDIFWFHALSAGNGRKPFKLAPCPRLIPLHALTGLPPEVTCTSIAPDMLLPGFGLLTLTPTCPADCAVPVAVSVVEDTTVVASAVPPNWTCAPLTKLLPDTVREKLPVPKVIGETLLMTGVGFQIVTSAVPNALESAALIALIVTVFGFGTIAGAV
jgi:hypothetical protein